MKLKLIEAPIGLFTFKNILCIKTEYSNTHSDKNGTFTTHDCYIISGDEYFWGNAKEARERNELIVEPVDAIVPVYCKDCKYFQSYVDDITGKTFNCGYCHKWNRDNKMMMNDTDYCSHGERKDDRNGE